MKHIGRTNEGEEIAQFTRDEFEAMIQAQHAADGLTFGQLAMRGARPRETNMQGFFEALEVFTNLKFRTNELRQEAEALDRLLGLKKEVQP